MLHLLIQSIFISAFIYLFTEESFSILCKKNPSDSFLKKKTKIDVLALYSDV